MPHQSIPRSTQEQIAASSDASDFAVSTSSGAARVCEDASRASATAAPTEQETPIAWIDKQSLAELKSGRSTYAHVVHKCRSVDGDFPLYAAPIGRSPK